MVALELAGQRSAGAAAIGHKGVASMAVIIDSTQIDYGTAGEAGGIIFSEPFADTPAIVASAGVSGETAAGFTIAGLVIGSRSARPRSRGRVPSSPLNDSNRTPGPGTSAEAVETLVWLAESRGIDRRRCRIENPLLRLHDSDEFSTLPDDLRQRIREILADTAR